MHWVFRLRVIPDLILRVVVIVCFFYSLLTWNTCAYIWADLLRTLSHFTYKEVMVEGRLYLVTNEAKSAE